MRHSGYMNVSILDFHRSWPGVDLPYLSGFLFSATLGALGLMIGRGRTPSATRWTHGYDAAVPIGRTRILSRRGLR
jgi:hypothetical protein